MEPARASAIAAVVFASVGLLGGAAALSYAQQDTGQEATAAAGRHVKEHQGKQKDKHERAGRHDSADNHGADASAPGRAHADAMRAWARCVAAAASNADKAPVPPKTSCGDKPAPPGRAKHDRDGNHGNSGHATDPKARGHAGSPED
jgi:hypothetical protein